MESSVGKAQLFFSKMHTIPEERIAKLLKYIKYRAFMKC